MCFLKTMFRLMNIFNVEIEEFWLDFEGSHWVIKTDQHVGHTGLIENQKSCSFGLVGWLHYYYNPILEAGKYEFLSVTCYLSQGYQLFTLLFKTKMKYQCCKITINTWGSKSRENEGKTKIPPSCKRLNRLTKILKKIAYRSCAMQYLGTKSESIFAL